MDSITDHYPKYLFTLDDDPPADYNGIKRLNALDFLTTYLSYATVNELSQDVNLEYMKESVLEKYAEHAEEADM